MGWKLPADREVQGAFDRLSRAQLLLGLVYAAFAVLAVAAFDAELRRADLLLAEERPERV